MDRQLSAIIKGSSLMREKSDYDDFFIASKKEAEVQLENAREFLNTVETYLNSL